MDRMDGLGRDQQANQRAGQHAAMNRQRIRRASTGCPWIPVDVIAPLGLSRSGCELEGLDQGRSVTVIYVPPSSPRRAPDCPTLPDSARPGLRDSTIHSTVRPAAPLTAEPPVVRNKTRWL